MTEWGDSEILETEEIFPNLQKVISTHDQHAFLIFYSQAGRLLEAR